MAQTYTPTRYASEIEAARATKGTPESARQAFEALDLTTLQDKDGKKGIETRDEMSAFLATAREKADGSTIAAVCVYPNHVRQAANTVKADGIGVATVVNFFDGNQSAKEVAAETRMSVKAGATEIDVVLPFEAFKAGDAAKAREVLEATRKAAPNATLKVILETNQLQDPQVIYAASKLALDAGADILKTSTGKNPGDVTLEHAAAMLAAIKDSGKDAGLKISKGVKTNDQAAQFMALADKIMGKDWSADNTRFRFGASSLRDDLIANIGGRAARNEAAAPASRPPLGSDY
jgi:deoxyribose-phosphate aldolase